MQTINPFRVASTLVAMTIAGLGVVQTVAAQQPALVDIPGAVLLVVLIAQSMLAVVQTQMPSWGEAGLRFARMRAAAGMPEDRPVMTELRAEPAPTLTDEQVERIAEQLAARFARRVTVVKPPAPPGATA